MQGLAITSEDIKIIYDNDYYQHKLERLFFTGTEEVPGFFNSGSKIMEFFFEPTDSITANAILFEIKRLITLYEPDIQIEKIGSGFIPLENEEVMLLIELDYHTIKEPIKTKTISLQKIRTLGVNQ